MIGNLSRVLDEERDARRTAEEENIRLQKVADGEAPRSFLSKLSPFSSFLLKYLQFFCCFIRTTLDLQLSCWNSFCIKKLFKI